MSNEQNAKRDDRKELRDQINDIAEAIRNVEADVVSYLTSAEGARTASYWTVLFGVRQINASIVSCKLFNTATITNLLLTYRMAITDKAMSGPNSPLPTGHELNGVLREVSSAGTGLVRGIESLYRDRYPFSK